MKDLKVGDRIEVVISKITMGKDNNLYVMVENDIFENRPTFLVREDKFTWKSDTGRITIR